MYGALGSLGVAVVRTDGAAIWATGKSWFQVPPVAQVTLTGTLPPGVTGKDVILALCSVFPTDVLNHGVEFVGSEETMSSLSIRSTYYQQHGHGVVCNFCNGMLIYKDFLFYLRLIRYMCGSFQLMGLWSAGYEKRLQRQQ